MSGQDHMHNPERQRATYRAPVHHVHSLTAAGPGAMSGDSMPERFVGNWGSLSIDTINQCLRVHDDVTPGGVAVTPLFSPDALAAPMWPFTPMQWNTVTFAAGQSHTFVGAYTRFPMVMAIDQATGEQVQVRVNYALNGLEYGGSFVVTSDVAADLIIIAQ